MDAVTKALMRDAWVEGYKEGKDVEEVQPISIRSAKGRFERWFQRNYG